MQAFCPLSPSESLFFEKSANHSNITGSSLRAIQVLHEHGGVIGQTQQRPGHQDAESSPGSRSQLVALGASRHRSLFPRV